LDESETNPDKPGRRWELSPQVGVDRFNYNVAVLRAGERLSQNAYHYHERQAEFFHVVENACRVEVDDGSFDLPADHVVHFEAGVNHLLHNPFEADCRLIAVGAPPEGRYPVHQVQSYEDLVEARYPNGDLSKPSEVV
jgi:uncharacterized cupin superfamily protein